MGGKNNEGDIIIEAGNQEVENKELVLARKQALEKVKLNAKGSEEEREKLRLSVVSGETSYADLVKGKKISHDCGVDNVKRDVNVMRKFNSDNDDVVWASKGVMARVLNGIIFLLCNKKLSMLGLIIFRFYLEVEIMWFYFVPGKMT